MHLDIYRNGDALFVQVHGRVVLDEVDRLKSSILPHIQPGVTRVAIDMANVEFIDSAGLGVLVGLKMNANKAKARLSIVSPSQGVADILYVSKLDGIFEVLTGTPAEVMRAEMCLPELRVADYAAPPPPIRPGTPQVAAPGSYMAPQGQQGTPAYAAPRPLTPHMPSQGGMPMPPRPPLGPRPITPMRPGGVPGVPPMAPQPQGQPQQQPPQQPMHPGPMPQVPPRVGPMPPGGIRPLTPQRPPTNYPGAPSAPGVPRVPSQPQGYPQQQYPPTPAAPQTSPFAPQQPPPPGQVRPLRPIQPMGPGGGSPSGPSTQQNFGQQPRPGGVRPLSPAPGVGIGQGGSSQSGGITPFESMMPLSPLEPMEPTAGDQGSGIADPLFGSVIGDPGVSPIDDAPIDDAFGGGMLEGGGADFGNLDLLGDLGPLDGEPLGAMGGRDEFGSTDAGLFDPEAFAVEHAPMESAPVAAPPPPKAQRAEDYIQRAFEAQRAGDYDRSADEYKKALELDPKNLVAHNNLAIVYEKKPSWIKQAIEQWERVLELSRARSDAKHEDRALKHLANLRRMVN